MGLHEISGVVSNFADEPAKEVAARLVVYKLLDNNSQQIYIRHWQFIDWSQALQCIFSTIEI